MKKTLVATVLAVILTVLLTSCGSSNEYSVEEYGDPAAFAGVWYSGAADGRAYILYADRHFDAYSVAMGEEPVLTGSGQLEWRKKGLLDFGRINDSGDFVREYQFATYEGEDILAEGEIKFNKISDEPNTDLLDSLTVMTVPVEAYIGVWVNDSNLAQITLTDTEYIIAEPDRMRTGEFTRMPDHLIVGMDNLRLEPTEDGGLTLEGMEGTFYPQGDERVTNTSYTAFIGSWYNETADYEINFSDDGTYTIVTGGFSGGGLSMSLSSGSVAIRDGMLIYTHDDVEHVAEISGDTMTISDIEGVFLKD